MKKVIIGGVVLVSAVAALRRIGPALATRAMKKCEEMFDHMPDDSPPKRIVRALDKIREQNTRILQKLEEHEPLALAAAD
jgi:hypothetical protein